MADRKLAYIATISNIEPIPGKDRIVYASLKDLGWQVIIDTSYKVGDKVIYVEIDSILPVKPEYEFLRKRCFSEKWNGFVIKGMKMAGLVSYGLVLPLPREIKMATKKDVVLSTAILDDGFDMTEVLGIRKKEDDVPEISNESKSKIERLIGWVCWKLGIKRKKKSVGVMDGWLSFAHKTDETRIENLSYLFNEEFKGTPVYTTVKMDGQSATFAVFKDWFFIASRNVVLYRQKIKKAVKELNPRMLKPNMDNFSKIACKYSLPLVMSNPAIRPTWENFVIQGEICGPGIQKNPMGLSDVDLFVFNVYLPPGNKNEKQVGFISWNYVENTCDRLGLKTVPFIERRYFDWPDKAALKEYAQGKYPNGNDREGVVIRYDTGANSWNTLPDPLRGMSNMWSFKVINDDYILGK